MIAYTMVGTKNLNEAKVFYDPIFALMGMEPCWNDDLSVSYGKLKDTSIPRFFIGYPFNKDQANVGNGTMTAFKCSNIDTINKIYETAISKGGSCEGPPDYRPHYGEGFYAAYLRDPDGNKVAFVTY